MSATSYLVPAEPACAQLRERGSRFLALLEPCREDAVGERLEALRSQYRDATHLCWAARFGAPARERASDAGEPRGTAGEPILRVLRGAGISDALGVVVRWFGGTKLGKGGLARAYGGAMREAVAAARLIERVPSGRLLLETDYAGIGAVERLIHPPAVRLLERSFGDRAAFLLEVHETVIPELLERCAQLGVRARRFAGGE